MIIILTGVTQLIHYEKCYFKFHNNFPYYRLLESCRTFSTSTDDVEHEAINFAIETYGLGLSATQDDLPSPDEDILIPQLDQPSTSQSSSQSQKTFLNDTHNVETEAVDYAIRRYGLQRNDLS